MHSKGNLTFESSNYVGQGVLIDFLAAMYAPRKG